MSSETTVRGEPKRRKLEPSKIRDPVPNSATLESNLNLLNQGKFADVTFIVGEGEERIRCHQLFLKARSYFFEVMFSERWNQDNKEGIPLPAVEPKAFKMFLQFIYADIFEVDVPEALELLQLAHMYQVQLLVDKCEKMLMLESSVTLLNAVQVFQAARILEKVQLMDTYGDFLTRSLPKLPTHPSFAHLDKETLMYLLKRNDLWMKEVDIFRVALQWARNQKDVTVKESLEDILPLIRFPIMTQDEFTTVVVRTEILPEPTVREVKKYFASDDEAKKLLAGTLGFCTDQRQRIKTDFYVPLYPEDTIPSSQTAPWSDRRTLTESLQICIQTPKYPVGPQLPILGFGLSSIVLYSPASSPTSGGARLDKFNFCLRSHHCHDGNLDFYSDICYETLHSVKSVDIEQDNRLKIDLDNVIALNPDTIYCITIMRQDEYGYAGHVAISSLLAYTDTDPVSTLDVNLRSLGRTTLTVRRNHLEGFDHRIFKGAHFICGLNFQEL